MLVLYCTVRYGTGTKLNDPPIRYAARLKVNNKLEICCTHSSVKLPFKMLTRLEVHHVISNDVTNVHNFSLLFGIREIPSELGTKVKATPSSLRVFATPGEAGNESFFGDRLDHNCSLFESNRREASELLEAGRFTFNADSSMVIFYLRVQPEEKLLMDSMGSEVINSTGGGAYKIKQRSRESKLVLSIVEQAAVFVWPRDHTGIPLPTNRPRASSGVETSPSNIMTKPAWVDHHLVLNIKSIAAQSGVHLESAADSLRAKAVRLVNGWRQDMLSEGSEKGVHADRAALWRSSPYGKLWLSGNCTAPIRPFTPCLAINKNNKASTQTNQ